MPTSAEDAFEGELEVFRREVEWGIQCFYAGLALNGYPHGRPGVLAALNDSPLFWITARGSLMSSTWIALGRVFDQDSPHNVDTVMRLAQKNRHIFSKESLGIRKTPVNGTAPEWLSEYLAKAHVPTTDEFRRLRKHVAKHRGLYNEKYRDIRNKIHAHREVIGADADALYAKTRISDVERLLIFLQRLYHALWEMFHNGRPPILRPRPYSASRMVKHLGTEHPSRHRNVQQIVIAEAKRALDRLASASGKEKSKGEVQGRKQSKP